MDRINIIKLQASLIDPKGLLLPRGVVVYLKIEIADEVATFWFTDSALTKRFASIVIGLEQKRGANDTIFMDRVQKIITKYPKKTREEIRLLILNQLKQMGANVKK